MVQPTNLRFVTEATLTELVQDAVAAMVTAGANVTKTYDDAAGTLTIAASGGSTTDVELVRDTIAASLSGTNGVTVTVNDAADTIVLGLSGLTISQVTGLQAALDAKVATLPDVTVAGTSGQLAAGVTSNVAASGAYTSPALDGAVATPPKRWAIKAASTGGCTVTYPDQGGASTTVTMLPGEALTFRQKTTSGWGAESGNKPLTQLDARYSSTFTGYDVILVAGQSNAVGFGIGVDAIYFDSPDPRIKQYACSGGYTSQIVNAIDPLLHTQSAPDSTRIGFSMTFAKDYLDYRAAPGRKVLIIPSAMGDTGFTSTSAASPPAGYGQTSNGTAGGSWDPAKLDGGFSLYQNAIDKTNAAIAANPGSRIVAILWIQGEADSALNQAQYAAKLDALIDGFRSNITGASTTPFVIGQMVPDWQFFNPVINAAHADTPNRKTRTAFALGPSGASNAAEPYHYNAVGQRIIGHSIYTAFAGI